MDIKTIEIAGIAAALDALRLPYGLSPRSDAHNDIVVDKLCNFVNDDNGTMYVHGTIKHHYWCSRGAVGAFFKLASEIFIDPKDLTLMSTLVKRGDEHAKVVRGIVVYAKITAPVYWWCELETYRAGHERLSSESTMHIDCKGKHGTELQHLKSIIPMGKELAKVDMFSYQCLRNIVRQRHDHRLPEWHQFIDWVKTLPFAEELILTGLEL